MTTQIKPRPLEENASYTRFGHNSYEYKGLHKIDMMDGRKVPFYFWMFLGGILVCYMTHWEHLSKYLNNRLIQFMLIVSSIGALLFILLSSTHFVNTFWRPLIPTLPKGFSMNGWKMPVLWFYLFFVVFLSATSLKNTVLNTLLQSPLLRHFGLLSYSMYLFHMNIMFVLQKKGFTNEGLFVGVLICSYIMAYFSYILIEKPFLSFKVKNKK